MPAPKTPKRTQKKRRSWFGWTVKWLFVLGLWAGIILAGIMIWYASELPDITEQASFERKSSITVLASDGSVLARYGDLKGNKITVDDVPDHLIHAVLSIEDRRFYSHFGLDPIGLARAMSVNIREGRIVQGGSTITQQLAKNLFLSHDRTLKRKIQEAMLALWLEHELSKDEILSAYLNRVYLGGGAYGMDAAASLYFDKDISDVTLQEAAILAGLLKAPSRFSPLANPSLARQRADVVLNAMVDAGYLSANPETQSPNRAPPRPEAKPDSIDASRYFTDWVVDGLDALIGTPNQDIVIETTLSPDIQDLAETAITQTLRSEGDARNVDQAAALVLRNDGAVLAMVGGKNYRRSQFNRAVQAQRPPGSAFKPVVYLAALEQGASPDDLILDAPIEDGSYKPENFKQEYFGEVPLRAALALSMNTAAVRLMDQVGRGAVIETARRLGIISPVKRNLSSALGSSGASLLEMTTAYATIANGGLRVMPYAITNIRGADGRAYYTRPEITKTTRVVEPQNARTLQDMMRDVVENGTGRRAALPFPVAGKTGTSQGFRDALFIGFSDSLTAGVWMGNDDNSPMNGVTGGSLPAGIWRDIVSGAHERGRQGWNLAEQASAFNDLLSRLVLSSGAPASTNEGAFGRPPDEDHGASQRYND